MDGWTDRAVHILDHTQRPHTVVYRERTEHRTAARHPNAGHPGRVNNRHRRPDRR
ncbi:MAG: hypothetical protein HY208_03515 [Nitrospirae bacterium]|nr:hypothetical protein [Nitrospirota bacterium]